MPKDFSRGRRIADQLQRELSEIIRLELKDPRVGMVTITDIEVSGDNSHAKVFFTVLGNDAQQDAATRALQHAAGFLRSQVAPRLRMRTVPQLHFVYDGSVERGMHLSKLIERALTGTPENGS